MCDLCGSNMVIESRGRCACSSRTNGGESPCANHLRVNGDVAEQALLSGIQDQLLFDDMIRYVRQRVADAVEVTRITETLAERLRALEAYKVRLAESNAEAEQQPAAALPDIIPDLVDRYRDLVAEIRRRGKNPHATTEEVRKARATLLGLIGEVKVKPWGDVREATRTINAAGLVRSTAAINSTFVVAGAFCT